MKQNKLFALIGLMLIFSFSSCSDYEDVPIEQYSMEYVFSPTDSAGTKALGYLNSIYMAMENGHNRIGNEYLDTASDDGTSAEGVGSDAYKLQVGNYSSTNRISDMNWGEYYNAIRKANVFVDNIDIVPLKERFNNHADANIPLNRAWKAEARFLRAYFYFELIKRYGGVPIMKEILVLGDDLEIPRNTFEECVDFIVDELEAIKDSLRSVPLANTTSNGHVATTEAAMALKSRVLLYAASPLFNERPIEANNPYIGYLNYDIKRWEKAAEAAKWFIDNNVDNKYALVKDFRDIFLNYYGTAEYGEDGNITKEFKEVIFYRATGTHDYGLEKNSGPLGFTTTNQGEAYNNPSQNLVDAFPMLDGKPIYQSDKYDYSYQTIYQNRDPRLGYTVLHNGSLWLTKELQLYQDGSNNPSVSARSTKTGYNLRKFLGNFEEQTVYNNVYHEWIIFRYAEMLLNYAEAQNEFAGATNEVYQIIKDLRERAGIEAGDDGMYGLKVNMDKDEMRDIIQNERRIEMAFEEQRYWDIRRWRIAEEIFKKPVEGLIIVRNAGMLEYNPVDVVNVTFGKERYFYPIPYTEVIKNKHMVQNPGWK